MSYGIPGVPMLSGGTAGAPAVPFDQPKNLFRFGEQSIWSTQYFAGTSALASTTNRIFVTPLGQSGQGFTNALTIGETNLKEGGRVPSGVAYDVFGIATQFGGMNQQNDAGGTLNNVLNTAARTGDIVNVQNNCALSWDFTQTQVDICPLILAGAGGGVFGAIATADAATPVTAGSLNNGNGSIWLYRKHPVALPGNSTFSIQLRFGSRAAAVSANGLTVRCVLMGYYKNVIEIG
jgi:hypothetical protein